VQIPIEIILGPAGAVAVLLLWVFDLRKQRDDLSGRLNKLVDELVAGIRKADSK
jgi:hypothetical protein